MLVSALEKFEVKEVDPAGEAFNPERHQAMSMQEIDGTASGTRRLGDIAAGTVSSSPVEMLITSERVLFSANDGVRGFELWALERPVGGAPGDLFGSGFESAGLGDWSASSP